MQVGVSILTNGSRLGYLKACIESLLVNCHYRPLRICIFNNGSTDDTHVWCQNEMPVTDGIEWLYDYSDRDLGCAAGQNRAAALVWDCEYALHLESDFEHLPCSLTGEDEMWMHRALDFMQSGGCDYLYLRRQTDERACFLHWWSQWMPRIDKDKSTLTYLKCPGFWWSNNPHLRRNEAIYNAGCLPMDESKDGAKGGPSWSVPELEAGHPGNTWLHRWGLFIHEKNTHGDLGSRTGCGRFAESAGVTCKYGFFKDGKDMFCQCCKANCGYEDLLEHEKRYRELW